MATRNLWGFGADPHTGIQDAVARQRRGLLATIHIAKAEMRLTEDEYGAFLLAFKVESAKDLTVPQMEKLVELFKHHGWKPPRRRRKDNPNHRARLDALRRRCVEAAQEIENGEKRLPGLAKAICGVSSLTWCRDAAKLERLLAVLGKIKEERL
jgi:phage gp16-like protein